MIVDSAFDIRRGFILAKYCGNDKNVVIPNYVREIADKAFANCDSVKKVVFPDELERIGDLAFDSCSDLAEVLLPESVKSIGIGAFSLCTHLKTVEVRGKSISISINAFSGCDNLNKIILHATDAKFYTDTFSWCHADIIAENLSPSKFPAEAVILALNGFSTMYSSGAELAEGYKKTYLRYIKSHRTEIWLNPKVLRVLLSEKMLSIEEVGHCLQEAETTRKPACISLVSQYIKDTIPAKDYGKLGDSQTVQELSVGGSEKSPKKESTAKEFTITRSGELTKYRGKGGMVEIPRGVKSIRTWAFNNLKVPTTIVFPPTIKAIENSFSHAKNLQQVVISQGTKSIDNHAFWGCCDLEKVFIPDSVSKIGAHAFENCPKLVSVTIPPNVREIAQGLFDRCERLAQVNIPVKVESIGTSAFRACPALEQIELPEGLKEIRNDAFGECTGLSSIRIPSTVNYIGPGIFSGAVNLKDIEVAPGNTSFFASDGILYTDNGRTLYGAPAVEGHFDVPAHVTKIADRAFEGCSKLTGISIGDQVESIGYSAFAKCSALEDVHLPAHLKTIERATFMDCINLRTLNIPASVSEIRARAFWNCTSETHIRIFNMSVTMDTAALEQCDAKITFEEYF